MTEFAERVKKRRAILDLSQEQAAERSRMSLRQYQRLEGGEVKRVSLRDAAKLAIGLETNTDYLAGNTSDDRPIISKASASFIERIVLFLDRGDKLGAIRAISDEEVTESS